MTQRKVLQVSLLKNRVYSYGHLKFPKLEMASPFFVKQEFMSHIHAYKHTINSDRSIFLPNLLGHGADFLHFLIPHIFLNIHSNAVEIPDPPNSC